uniref:Uncharacterized protein n=1 Tax=Arundo donax TaxID=35708 RepID=A0A0A9EIT2_ARUDO
MKQLKDFVQPFIKKKSTQARHLRWHNRRVRDDQCGKMTNQIEYHLWL